MKRNANKKTILAPLYTAQDWQREKPKSKVAWRSESRRDYARLLHSSAFRRLQGKTQLFPGNESDFFRNRLTHSLEVAQIATAIGGKLNNEQPYLRKNPVDIDLLEFAGIAHDLGHPPFGHNGEKALDDSMKPYGGFEGNAQTLRILAKLEKKERRDGASEDERLGLNLCYRTLASILKYDRPIPKSRKKRDALVKGYYSSEAELVERIKKAVVGKKSYADFKTVECRIMDIADDIAYSTYDLEDAFKVGFLSPLRILQLATDNETLVEKIASDISTKHKQVTADDVRGELLKVFGEVIDRNASLIETAVTTSYRQSRAMRDGHYRTALTSGLVDYFIGGVRFKIDESHPCLSDVYLDPSIAQTVEVLKRFTFEVLIESPMLKFIEYRGYDVVTHIFLALSSENGHKLLPDDCRDRYLSLSSKAEQMRLVCDFVAGMTDRYAWEFFGRLTTDNQSIFRPVA